MDAPGRRSGDDGARAERRVSSKGDARSVALPEEGRTYPDVLLVEDDEVAALVKEILEQLGYEVTRAASAIAACGDAADALGRV